MIEKISHWVEANKDTILSTYNHIHTNAEISWEEIETTKFLCEKLDQLGMTYQTFPDHTGVIGYWGNKEEGPIIGIRADIDALWQLVDGEWRANHSCGHDAHATMVLNAITCLKEIGFEPKGLIKIIFQPAEESGKGAKALIEKGVINDLDYLLGIHVRPIQELRYGQASPGIYHGATINLQGKITGVQAHGARPNLGVNVVDSLGSIIQAVNSVKADPTVSYSAKVTQAAAGGKNFNIIPDYAEFGIDVRAQRNDVMDELLKKLQQAIVSAGSFNGAKVDLEIAASMAAAEPSLGIEEIVRAAIIEVLGEKAIAEPLVTPGGEDFHFYKAAFPRLQATMVGLGTDLVPGLHHPKMNFNLDSLQNGVNILAVSMVKLLNREFIHKKKECCSVNLKEFEEVAEKVVEKHQIPGASVALAHEGKLTYFKGFGFRTVEDALPVTEETAFGIGSITKSFTCVAIMQLQEAGKLNVHDQVTKYLPEFQVKDQEALAKMTIHHFMTHSAGLPPMSSLVYAMKRSTDNDPSANKYPGLKVEKTNQGPIDTYDELMQFIASQDFDLLGDPGTQFSYSNDCFALLGTIIERVSGKPYEQYVYDHILKPAGMNHSFFTIEEYGDYNNVATCYAEDKQDGRKRVVSAPVWWDTTSMRAAGFLKSTASDMLKYAEIFRNNGVVNDKRILSEDSVNSMLTPYIQIQPGRYYGYGFMITPDYFGTKLVEHGGSLKAVAAQLSILPDKGLTGVVLTNLAGVPSSRIMHLALNGDQGREIEATHVSFEEITLPLERLEQYVGEYQSNEGMKVKLDIRNGNPVLTTQEIEIPIAFVNETVFIANVNDSIEVAEILLDKEKQPKGISYHFRQFPKVAAKQTVKHVIK